MRGFASMVKRPRPQAEGAVNYATGGGPAKARRPDRVVPGRMRGGRPGGHPGGRVGGGRGEAARRLLSKRTR